MTDGHTVGSAMNKILRRHVPASALPAHLREGIDPGALVSVTVEVETPERPRPSLAELRVRSRTLPSATDDPVSRIRALRDEWDD